MLFFRWEEFISGKSFLDPEIAYHWHGFTQGTPAPLRVTILWVKNVDYTLTGKSEWI